MIEITKILLFFPSVTFGILSAEIFPWALFYSIIKFSKFKRNNLYLPICFYLIISVIYSFFLILFESQGDYFELIRSIFAYLNSILIFIYILSVRKEEVKSLQKIVFYILAFQICLGIFQYFNLIEWLQPVLSFLTPRAMSLGGGFRGATLLSSEPSRAATEFIFNAFLVYILIKNIYYRIFIFILILIYIIFIFKSLDGIVLFLIATIIFFKVRAIFMLIVLCMSLYLFSDDLASSSRLFQFIQELKTQSNMNELFSFIMNNSGFRLSSILSSYYYGIFHFFGAGIGQWQTSSIVANEFIGFDPSKIFFFIENGSVFIPLRPSSYVANLMLDFGIIGTALVLALIKNFIPNNMSRDQIAYVSLFFFSLLFVSSVGNPVPWICCAIALRQNNIDEKIK